MHWDSEEYRKELGKYLANWVKGQITGPDGKKIKPRYKISQQLGFDKPGEKGNECNELKRLENGHPKWKIEQLFALANAASIEPSTILHAIEQIIISKK